MKKMLIIILFCLVLKGCNSSFNSFKKTISKYDSYNKSLLNNYYEQYLKTNSYIYALNSINHPTFYNKHSNVNTFNDIILVNKYHKLDKEYIPKNLEIVSGIEYIKRENETMLLDKTTLNKLKELFLFAKDNNINLVLYSGYRSFDKQASLWDSPFDFNNMYKAVPGYSEHQTGLAVDISTIDHGLSSNKNIAYKFLEDNAYKFGFIQRYKENKSSITGYNYEPWHYRYVGDISYQIYENNLTLEEYIYNYIEIKNL